MKKILLALLASLPFLAIAQQRAAFEIHASPNFTDYTKKIVDASGKLGYDFGLRLILPIKESKLEGVAGLQLSTFGTMHATDELRWGNQHDGNGGYDPTVQPGQATGIKFKHNYYFLQIPLGVRYYLSKEKLRLYLQPSIAPAIYLTNQTKTTLIFHGRPNESTSSWGGNTTIRKANLFAALGIGLEIPVNDKITIGIQPHGGIQLLAAAKDSPTGARLYSAGLDMAFRYHFY